MSELRKILIPFQSFRMRFFNANFFKMKHIQGLKETNYTKFNVLNFQGFKVLDFQGFEFSTSKIKESATL